MSGQLTEKQHYVWRRYLRPWKQKPQDRGLWTCILSQKKVAMVGEMDVAQASYFYKIEELNKEQLNFLRQFVSTQPHGVKDLVKLVDGQLATKRIVEMMSGIEESEVKEL